jgi:hypothetical protein
MPNGLFVAGLRQRVAARILARIVRTAMAAAPAIETVALAIMTVRAVLRRLRRLSAGDEGWQPADIVVALLQRLLRLRLLLRLALLWLVLRLRLILRPAVLRLLISAVRLLPAKALLLRGLEVRLLVAEILL